MIDNLKGFTLILRNVPLEYRADREVVLAAVEVHGGALKFASEPLRSDRDVVMAAVTSLGSSLEFASEALRSDRDVVAAVANDGTALKFASDPLRSDREVVLAAVTQQGSAIEFASESLRGDLPLLKTAMDAPLWPGMHGACGAFILLYAADRFEGSRELAEELLRADPGCFPRVCRYLAPTPEVLDAAFGCHDLASLASHPDDLENEECETFLYDLDESWGFESMSAGQSKDVGNCVTILCWHDASSGDSFLKFYVLKFQSDTFCLTLGGRVDPNPPDADRPCLLDRYAVFCSMGKVFAIGDRGDYFELLCDLEDPDSMSGWWEELNS